MNTPLQGRRSPNALLLLAIGVCILVAVLLFGAAAPPPARAGTGSISGTVKDTHGHDLADVTVLAYASVDDYQNQNATWTQTGPQGFYSLDGLQAGQTYLIRFDDAAGNYVDQFYPGQPTIEAANPVAVTDGVATQLDDAWLADAGHITGTVTDANHSPLQGIWVNVYAYLDDFNNGNGLTGTQTDQHGYYDLNNVPVGRGRRISNTRFSGRPVSRRWCGRRS